MAHITKFYVGEVLEKLCERLSDVTELVFSEHRPKAMGEQMGEFLVVSVPTTVLDKGPWQAGVVRVEVAVRNKATGISNTKRLNELVNGISWKFPIVENRFTAFRPQLVLQGADSLGFTVWVLQGRLTVNTTDSYVYDTENEGVER